MAEGNQVLVKLVTKLPSELRVPETPVAVPASLKRYGLSQIINHLLALDPPRPFDFIINGELLRKPLEAHLLQHGLSAEAVLEVEYVPAVLPPKEDKCAPHDDWVSSVDGLWGAEQLVSGSYDGCVRTWNVQGDEAECTGSWQAHAGGVNSVACGPGSGSRVMYSAGKDQAVLMWQVSSEGTPQLIATFQGHTDCVEALGVSPSGQLLASAGWDKQLLIWQAGEEVVEAAAEAALAAPPPTAGKRRKGAAAPSPATAPAGGLPQQPTSHLQGHSQCVSSVTWADEGSLFSGGWDHSVRRWDAATGINTDTYNGSKVVCCVATPPPSQGSSGLVAFGCSDKVLRVWDSRAKSSSNEGLAVKHLPAHAGWLVSVAWCPNSAHHVATASHDHTIKLWDLRCLVPLATLASHTDKALCVTWLGGSSQLASGGADCKLRTYTLDHPL